MPQWPWKRPRPGVDEYGRSPVWHHAAVGDLAALQADLASGLDATAADKDGYSALHVAVQNGHVSAVSMLLDAGADPNATDRHGNGPLWTACYEGLKAVATPERRSIISLLLRHGAVADHLNNAGRSPENLRSRSPEVDAQFRVAGR